MNSNAIKACIYCTNTKGIRSSVYEKEALILKNIENGIEKSMAANDIEQMRDVSQDNGNSSEEAWNKTIKGCGQSINGLTKRAS